MDCTSVNWAAIPGTIPMPASDFLSNLNGTQPTLRLLDDLSQGPTILLNIFFLFSILSLLPTASHLLTAYSGWSQRSLATTWLLAEVMDPLGFLFGFLTRPCTASREARRRSPIQISRVAVVGLLAVGIMGIELIFIAGQSSRVQEVLLLRAFVSPFSSMLINDADTKQGMAGIKYVKTKVNARGAISRPIFQWSERSDATYWSTLDIADVAESRNAAFIVATSSEPKPELVVTPVRPLNVTTSPAVRTALCLQGLSPSLTSLFIPFAWMDAKAVKAAVDAVAIATGSEQCNWRVSSESSGDYFYVESDKELCHTTITADMQRDITVLLSRFISCRVRVGSSPEVDALSLVDIEGSAPGEFNIQETLGLSGKRQLIPNVILVFLSCVFVVVVLLRTLCLGQNGEYAARDYAIVAEALEWDKSSSFARVAPGAKVSSLPSRNIAAVSDRFNSQDVITVSGDG